MLIVRAKLRNRSSLSQIVICTRSRKARIRTVLGNSWSCQAKECTLDTWKEITHVSTSLIRPPLTLKISAESLLQLHFLKPKWYSWHLMHLHQSFSLTWLQKLPCRALNGKVEFQLSLLLYHSPQASSSWKTPRPSGSLTRKLAHASKWSIWSMISSMVPTYLKLSKFSKLQTSLRLSR